MTAAFVFYAPLTGRIFGWQTALPDMDPPPASASREVGPVTASELALIDEQIAEGYGLNMTAEPGQPYFEAAYDREAEEGGRVTITLHPEGHAPPAATEVEIRARRDRLLTECDWTQAADAPLTIVSKATFIIYRQALREITEQPGFPAAVVWPDKPTPVKL